MTLSQIYPIGTPGTPWGPAEVSQWRARQVRQRSYADDVLSDVEALSRQFTLEQYGKHFKHLRPSIGPWKSPKPT